MKLEGYLSNKIQSLYPKSKVLVSDNGDFILQRLNEKDLNIGKSFKEARASIFAMLRADIPLLHQNHLRAYNLLCALSVEFFSRAPDRNQNIMQLIDKARELINLEENRKIKFKKKIKKTLAENKEVENEIE